VRRSALSAVALVAAMPLVGAAAGSPGAGGLPRRGAPPARGAPAVSGAAPAPTLPPPAVLPPVPATLPEFSAPAAPSPEGSIAGVQPLPFVGIDVRDAIAMALARNTDLAIDAANRRIYRYRIEAAKGAYDVQFQLQPSYSVQVQPAISSFQSGPNGFSTTQVSLGAQAALNRRTVGGGIVSLTTSARRTNDDTTVNSYNPFYQTSVALNLSQPLARGRVIDPAREQLELSRINADLSTDQALAGASQTLVNVLTSYDDLIAAWRNLAINEEALRQARAQAESNRRLVLRGRTAPVDVVESNAQVDIYQDDVYSALQNVSQLQNRLKTLLLADPGDPLWRMNLVPTSLPTTEPLEPDVDALVLAAIRNRPEIAEVREARRQADLQYRVARDQLRPEVTLNAGITELGFAGAPLGLAANPLLGSLGGITTDVNGLIAATNPGLPAAQRLTPINAATLGTAPPGFLTGKIGRAYDSMLAGRFPQYTIGATLAFPLQNRTAKGNYGAALEQERTAEIQQIATLQRVKAEANDAVQGYRTGRSRVAAARAARAAAEDVYASEVRKFRAGESTTFLVLQRAVSLANERGRELQAQTSLEESVVELDRVGGTIFRHYDVNVEKLGAGVRTGGRGK